MSKIFLTIAVVIGFILGMGLQHARIAALKTAQAKTLQTIAEKTAAANTAVTAYIQKTQKEAAKSRQQTHERIQEIQGELADATASRDAYAERVRNIAKSRPAKSSNSSAAVRPAGPSEQDQAALDLFAQLLDRHTKELVEVGRYAEELRAAGLGCERKADIQIPPPTLDEQSFILSPTTSQE